MKHPNKHPRLPTRKTGVLLINLGTPDSTKWLDIRKYLKEFLSDKRVIEVNPILWQIILNLFILTFRPAKTAKAYKKIWMKKQNMSPLRYFTRKQTTTLQKRMKNPLIEIDYAMRYGNPSIAKKLSDLKDRGCQEMIILPLYPQYAAATTATVCDEVYRSLMKMRWQPSLQVIPHYESEPLYIKALAISIKTKLKDIKWRPDVIVASYHGIPKKYFDKGDPYHCYCHKTTRLLVEHMKIDIPIITTFQSRFGPEEWLKPYTDETIESLPKEGKKKAFVICPGFASDCVETLEEISIEAKESFMDNGGEKFLTVPCLNSDKEHIDLFEFLIKKYLIRR
tara:strand:- start:916 stop:1926 length:1011 start_codon:yes stop_codon:yes gene_type:complete